MKFSRIGIMAAFMASIFVAQQAQAHAHLKSTEPAAKSEVTTSPKSLTLSFTEDLEANFSGVELKNGKGDVVKTGKATLSPANKSQLVIPLDAPLASGNYEVDWHALSVDGHKTQGTYNFSVK
ncbi:MULTISPECIES: copper homeostasis periplasmic binding protein CopC [Dickeya]|uniref:Copper resistance protein C n=1 Tax=Dickeya aquatica TaxID=1401087 RepID=A0A375A9G7_9GAMM|nr:MULTISPECIES: copper homeostasis periplasmic binding protein CopC [Dickeya]SLM62752.1 Copper resistance protein C precursor [Dickeya aquatica]